MAKKNKPEEPKGLKRTFIKFAIQRNGQNRAVLIAVVPDDFLGVELPMVSEVEACLEPKTILNAGMPTITINPDTIKDNSKEFGMYRIDQLAMGMKWMIEVRVSPDELGISLDK